jgi:hypothetical protein
MTDDDPLRRTVARAVEDRILGLTQNRREMVVAVDAHGHTLFERMGGPEGVIIDDATRHGLRGRVDLLTHNHPLGTPPSDADVAFAIDIDAREVNAFGRSVRWRIVRVGQRWPPLSEFLAALDHEAKTVLAALQARVDAREIDVERAERAFYTLLWPRLEDRRPTWFTFLREERQ